MVLSADWFFERWSLLGLCIDPVKREALKLQCRSIVPQILDLGALGKALSYYHASFTDERVFETRRRFLGSVEQLKVDQSFIDRTHELFNRADTDVDAESTFLPTVANIALARSPSQNAGQLSPELVQSTLEVWSRTKPPEIDLEGLERSCRSEWDLHLRSLASGRDTWLSDHISQRILSAESFRRFWDALALRLSPNDRTKLVKWYVTAIEERLGGKPYQPPDWMK
jgi:hypothetical protein